MTKGMLAQRNFMTTDTKTRRGRKLKRNAGTHKTMNDILAAGDGKKSLPGSGGKTGRHTDSDAERRRIVNSLRGKYAWIPYSSDDFARDKRREIALEDRA